MTKASTAKAAKWRDKQDKFWPRFTVECQCGSHNIQLLNTMGYSETSGSWGDISFQCDDCGNATEIVSA